MIIYPVYPIAGNYDQSDRFDVSVIVPLYKSNKVILDQIQKWHQSDTLKVELIYIDDKCPTKSKTTVFSEWSKLGDKSKHNITLVLSNKNKGFAGACNLGAMHARGKFLIFLNADTIVTPNWIDPMIELFEDKTVGIVGNLQIKEGGKFDNTIDSAGSEWSWEFMNFMHIGRHFFNGKPLEKPFDIKNIPDDLMKVSEREMVTGCCFAIPKDLFNEVNGFDEKYKIGYWEDSELNMSIQDLGYKIMFTPKSLIYHKLSHSNVGTHQFHDENRRRFFKKWIESNKIDKFIKDKRPDNFNLNEEVLDRVSSVRMTYYRNTYKNSIRWDGNKSIKDKVIIIYCEQGLGDTIQFSRYFEQIKKMCKKIYLHCPKELHSLFKDHINGVDEILDKEDENLPEHDFHVLSMSLPFLLKKSKEKFPYININEKVDIGFEEKYKIGIAWEGSQSHTNNKQRSCYLKHFKFLDKYDKVKVFMVQSKINMKKWLKDSIDFNLYGWNLPDFKETAKLVNSLDLIISVDTSVLHLAGSMNKKAFGLMSIPGDKRWEVHNWYPSISIISQKKPGNWKSVFEELESKVKELL